MKIFYSQLLAQHLGKFCISTIFGGISAAHAKPNFLQVSTQQVGILPDFSYKHLHCYERWVGPNYLLQFQISVDMLVLGYKVEPLRFIPPFGSGQILAQNSRTTSGHLHMLPLIPTQWTHSTDHSITSEFTSLVLYTFNNLKQVQDHRPGVHSPRYFHTTHSVSNCLHQIHSLLQMSQPSITCCYEEFVEDLSLLHWFPWEEYSSTQKLPFLGAPWFRLVLEVFFYPTFFSLLVWRWVQKPTNMVILIPNGVGKSYLGMVTVFCHPEQARIEACDALSALCQHNSCELSVVMVRRYSNTPYIPRGMSHSLYLDMSALSGGIAFTQFPLHRLGLCWLLPFSKTEVLLPIEVGGEDLKMYHYLPEFLCDSSEEDHSLSSPISLSIPLPVPASLLEVCAQTEGGLDSHSACIQMEGGLACHPTGTQTEGLGYHPSLKLLWEANQARTQLEWELIQETQELAEKCKHKWAKQARRHARRRAQMINQTNATLKEVMSQESSTEAIKLLPWCISVVVPLHFISKAATMAAYQDEGVSIASEACPMATEPELHSSLVPGPSRVLTALPVMFPLPVFSIPDIPSGGTPLLGRFSC